MSRPKFLPNEFILTPVSEALVPESRRGGQADMAQVLLDLSIHAQPSTASFRPHERSQKCRCSKSSRA